MKNIRRDLGAKQNKSFETIVRNTLTSTGFAVTNMKYQLIGQKIPYHGKTLWEIVGNLKNFGVGRMVKHDTNSTPVFFKIVKVVVLPPPKNKFLDRGVIVWIEKFFNGIKFPIKQTKINNHIPKFQLIPKSEEEEYLKRFEESMKNFTKTAIPKYCQWPPLYEVIWKNQIIKNNIQLPKLENVITKVSKEKTTFDENLTSPQLTSSLHVKNVPVENMIKQIVQLKKAIKAHSP